MNNGLDPFEVLREQVQTPEPTSEEISLAKARLQRAIAAEQNADKKLEVGWKWRVVAAITVAAAIVIVAVPLIRTSPAQAALVEIAQAARQATPIEVLRGSYITTTSEQTNLAIRPGEEFGLDQESVAYLLPTTRQIWRQPAKRFVLLQTTVGIPEFFDPSHQRAYYAAGLDEADQIGQTIVEQFVNVTDPIIETEWPTNPDDLLQAMEELIGENDRTQSIPSDLFLLAADLLRETNPSPQLRAAVLEVLGELPLDVQERGQLSITISLLDGDRQLTMELSDQGDLLSEAITLRQADLTLGIPADTVISKATHRVARVVDDLPIQSETTGCPSNGRQS
jgi:hypothetical protein